MLLLVPTHKYAQASSHYMTIQLLPLDPFPSRCSIISFSSATHDSKVEMKLFRSLIWLQSLPWTNSFRIVARYLILDIKSSGNLSLTDVIFSCNPFPTAPNPSAKVPSNTLDDLMTSSKSLLECTCFEEEDPMTNVLARYTIDAKTTVVVIFEEPELAMFAEKMVWLSLLAVRRSKQKNRIQTVLVNFKPSEGDCFQSFVVASYLLDNRKFQKN